MNGGCGEEEEVAAHGLVWLDGRVAVRWSGVAVEQRAAMAAGEKRVRGEMTERDRGER